MTKLGEYSLYIGYGKSTRTIDSERLGRARIMFHREPGRMRRSVVDPVNHEIMAEPEASAELVETLRELDEALQIVYERTVSEIWNCCVEMLREVNEALGRVGRFSELVTAMENNKLLKEYGSPIDAWAIGFSLN
jgi:hypothetical protein